MSDQTPRVPDPNYYGYAGTGVPFDQVPELAPRVPDLWWSPTRGVITHSSTGGYWHLLDNEAWPLPLPEHEDESLPADAVRLVPIPSEPLPDSETERPRRCPALTPESDLITAGRQCQQYEGHPHDHSWYGDNGHACSLWAVTS